MNKHQIVILAETGSDFPKALAKKYNVTIVPMHVMFEDKDYNDGEFPVSEIIEYHQKTKKIPTTSASNVGDYITAFESIHRQNPNSIILHLSYSAITTASYQNAMIASEGIDYVHHIDTKFVSGAQALIIYKTINYLENNDEFELGELLGFVNHTISKLHMSFMPSQLDFLKAGGRVSNTAYLGASILGLMPMIEIVNGQLICTKKYRGRDYEKVCIRMIKDNFENYKLDTEDVYLIYTYGLKASFKKNIEAIIKSYHVKNVQWIEAGGVITTHGGPQSFGLVFSEK